MSQKEIDLSLPNIADGEDKSFPFKNRIRKNYRHIRKWAKRTVTNCFRIYDRDIPRVPVVIDFYAGRFCVQYYSRTRLDPDPSPQLVQEIEDTLTELFATSKEFIFWRTRTRRERTQQHEKLAASKEFFTVYEHGLQFWINLQDYLDTGLFLDHRETRQLVAKECKGKRLLNLFAYTCSFSVQAAGAGAVFTKSVDMSNTYTDWGRENFVLNGWGSRDHDIVRADCMRFLDQEIRTGNRYDVVVIDPPTISRSKKMDEMFDIQKDYPFLISRALKLLTPGGVIYFSTNSRQFTFDGTLFQDCTIWDITKKTIPLDFHDQKSHRCWRISTRRDV